MSNRQRILLYLYSNKNLVGSVLGLAGLLMYFTGVIDRFWLLIVVGLYFIGVLATPRNPIYQLKLKNQITADEIRSELDDLIRKIRGKVPDIAFQKVESIKSSIMDILPYITDVESADYNVFTIRRTALDYLPETLENYLNLPPAYRNIHPVKDGKTAKQILIEQLDILDKEMKEISEYFYRDDTQKLLVHSRFLEEKFAKPDLLFQP